MLDYKVFSFSKNNELCKLRIHVTPRFVENLERSVKLVRQQRLIKYGSLQYSLLQYLKNPDNIEAQF